MAIDLEALRRKHEQINNSGKKNDDFLENFFSLEMGDNLMRILPPKDEDKEFYAETKIHRVPNGDKVRNFHCRRVHDEACPLCDLYFALWKTGRKEDEATARLIKPRARYYLNVLNRETGDVKILSIGIMIFKKITGAILDPDYGDITDLKSGHDFKIHKEMEGEWPKYDQSAPRPKSTPAGTAKEIATMMDSLHDIHGLVKVEEYDVLKEAASGLMGIDIEPKEEVESEEVSSEDYLDKLKS
jgi:hypothetical protein